MYSFVPIALFLKKAIGFFFQKNSIFLNFKPYFCHKTNLLCEKNNHRD